MNNEIIQETVESEKLQNNKNAERTLKRLKERRKNLLSTLKDYRRKNTFDVLWFLMWTIAFVTLIYLKKEVWIKINIFQSIIYYLFTIISFIVMLYRLNRLSKNRKIKIDSNFELSIIEDDIFLEEIKGLNYEEKALKQLSKKQIDIERYHALNISHTKTIFIIGVIIIFIGISIIAFTIASIFFTPNSAQLIVIISGFVGGLLVDGIGGIFIFMYSKTIESTQEYQTTMAETTNTYLGNVLVSQINNNELREQTLSIMATELVQKVKSKEK
jgi:hypothetical protein